MDEKIKLILDNKDAAIAAVESYLDKMYYLTDMFFKDGKLKEDLIHDEKAENFIKSILDDEKIFEDIRRKLTDCPNTIDIIDVNRIGLAFFYCAENLKIQSKKLSEACTLSENISKSILGTIDQNDIKNYLN